MARKRLHEIDIATGIAIILVVTGHLSDYDPLWYGLIKISLYKFHMPLFMFLSGFLLGYTRDNFENIEKYTVFLKSKSIKFIVPYLFMSLLFLCVKIILHEINSWNKIMKMAQNILIAPTSGASIFLWYVYVLFQFYIIFPLLYSIRWLKTNLYFLLIIGVVLNLFNPFSGFLELDQFGKYFIYFASGFLTSIYYHKVRHKMLKWRWLFYFCFFFLLSLDISFNHIIPEIFLAFVAIPAFLTLSIQVNSSVFLESIGQKTFTIYIWNSVFIFSSKSIISKFDPVYKEHFYFYFPLLISIGILLPFLLSVYSRKSKINLLKFIIP